MSDKDVIQPGMFLTERLVTDTVVWEVVATTAKTVTLRKTNRVKGVENSPSPWAVEYAVEPAPGSEPVVRKVRKDGTIRMADWARPLHVAKPKQFQEGLYYYEFVDWSY